MTMASPTFSAAFCCARTTESTSFSTLRTAMVSFPHRAQPQSLNHQVAVLSPVKSFKPTGAGGYVSPDNSDLPDQLHNMFPHRISKGSPVYVMLPVDVVGPGGQVRRRKAMVQSFRALAAAGVEGVVMEVWWGLVERDAPGAYNWHGYLENMLLAKRCGLKVRIVMAFHQCGTGPADPHWIPLPQWVLEEIDRNPNMMYSDRFGRRSMDYISIGCDILPVLLGRSPIQAYTDFMRNFRDTFRSFLGVLITGIQIGMGPAGELRYPSCPSQKLTLACRVRELGEFQCYDKYMLASLNACAQKIEKIEWGNGGPIGTANLMHDLEQTEFFKSDVGSWNTAYGKFFLEWYSGMLLLHGQRICKEAETIFRGTEVNTSAKLAGIHWHYGTKSHPSELTAGYYNTATRDGYLPILRMLGRYGFTLCISGFEMQDVDEKPIHPTSSPESFLRQILLAARICNIPIEGENFAANLDDRSFQQVLKMSKYYLDGFKTPLFSFKFVRMDKNMFEYQNWVRFTRFVKQMSDGSIFRAKLNFRGGGTNVSSRSDFGKARLSFAYS